jgi:hypothetical protein
MRYADTLLTQGEVIVVRSRQHWLALFIESRTAVALWVIGVLMLLAVIVFKVTDDNITKVLSYIGIGAIALGILIFLYHYWRWWSQDYLVTNRRILKVEGVINKHAADSSLEKINDAVLDQNLFGRIFNYGDLDILTAAETAIDQYRMLNKAPSFKREMLQQKYALETEFAYHAPPTPPLRSDPEVPRVAEPREAPAAWQQAPAQAPLPGDGGASEGVGGAPAFADPGPPAAAHESDSTAVTQTLARLADLRDRGAITPEEYETKKDELLGRL